MTEEKYSALNTNRVVLSDTGLEQLAAFFFYFGLSQAGCLNLLSSGCSFTSNFSCKKSKYACFTEWQTSLLNMCFVYFIHYCNFMVWKKQFSTHTRTHTHQPWGRIHSAALCHSRRWYHTTSCHHGAHQRYIRCSCVHCRGKGSGTDRRWSFHLGLPQRL